MAGPQVIIDPSSWYTFAQDARKFDPALLRALRKRVKGLGQKAVDKVKDTLELPSPAGGPGGTGQREALSGGTRLALSFAKRGAGVKITTSGSRLGASHKGFLGAYNKEAFRHPVFGNTNAWSEQQGRPYFGKVIEPLVDKEMLTEMRAALDDAMRAMGGVRP